MNIPQFLFEVFKLIMRLDLLTVFYIHPFDCGECSAAKALH
jgi:hypothetical protein